MKKWNQFKNLKPVENDYPIVIVSKRENKKRTAYNVNVVLEEIMLHLNLKRGYVFTKWMKLPDFKD